MKTNISFRFSVCAIALISSTLSSNAMADSFVCTPKAATGFDYNASRNSWEPGIFTPNSTKYVIKPNSRGELEVWPNNESTVFTLKENSNSKDELLNFRYYGATTFTLNVKTLRYMRTILVGYVSDGPNGVFPEGSATPSVEIGTCRSF